MNVPARKLALLCPALAAIVIFGCAQPPPLVIIEKPEPPVSPPPGQPSLEELKTQINRLLVEMSAREYRTREKATINLRKLLKNSADNQEKLVNYIQEALDKSPDPELRCRLKSLLGYLHTLIHAVQLNLIWVGIDSLEESRDPNDGRTLLKIKDKNFPFVSNEFGELLPDNKELRKYLRNAVWNFEPTKFCKTLPVIISARSLVPTHHIEYILQECKDEGIPVITLDEE